MRTSRSVAMTTVLIAVCGLAMSGWSQSDAPKTTTQPQQPQGNPVAAPTPEEVAAMMKKPGGGDADEPAQRPFADVSKGYEKVISTADGKEPYFGLWVKKKDGSMLAELPRGYESHKQFIAMTVTSGETYAGLQAGHYYVYWKKFDNRLMLIQPNVETRTTGDQESKSSVKRLFTDRVLLDVAIITTGPNGQPVIDMKDLLIGRIQQFFGGSASGANARLASVKSAKAFPENVEIGWELPVAGGVIKEFHYSISHIKDNSGYTPRVADERVGYFTTVHRDLGKFTDQDKWIRYVNRWHIEKAEPGRKLSPPKEPIIFYLDHSLPIRYRRYAREGILSWNKAFEKIGILGAIEVYQQDERTGAHMEKDPEDVRYNFVRWLSNDIGTAIGPSRTNPLTGEILDADIVLTDGWIRHYWMNFNEALPEIAMEGFSPETMAWIETHPKWDPRIQLAPPEQRDSMIAQKMQRGVLAYGGHAIAAADPANAKHLVGEEGDQEFTGLGQQSQIGLCMAAKGKAFDVSMLRLMLDTMEGADASAMGLTSDDPPADDKDDEKADDKAEKGKKKKDDKKDAKKDEAKPDMVDGIPEWFIGPLLTELVAHECGHTLGLRHNFKSSSIYTMAQIGSDEVKGKKSFVGSVMDYTPINLNVENGKMIGDVAPMCPAPYDYWAIEYGYTTGDTKEVLKRVAEPELAYGTDEDVGGPDPSIRRYDLGKDPIEYAKAQMVLANYHRGRLLDKFVKDGQSWARVRRGYNLTLGMQTRSVNMMAAWIGGAYVNRARKGDPNAQPPIDVVDAAQQRDALKWVIDNSFKDEAYGLTPELLSKMTVDKWMDQGGFSEGAQENTWPLHDRIAGIQAATLTMIMNPTTLRRVYDNEFLVSGEKDAITLAEVIETVHSSVWNELDNTGGRHTARKPAISSLRRNLQREYLDRLIELSLPGAGDSAAYKPVSNLSMFKLRQLRDKIASIIGEKGDKTGGMDPYSLAHLSEAKVRIEKALDASYVYNAGAFGGGGFPYSLFFGQGANPNAAPGIPNQGGPGGERLK